MMETFANHLRINILTSPSAWGGMEAHTVALARILESKGHDVSIVEVGANVYQQKKAEKNIDLTIIPHNGRRLLRNPGFIEAIRILRNLNGNVCIYPKGGLQEGNCRLDLAARLLFSRYITIEHLTSQPKPVKSNRRYFWGLIPGLGLWWYKRFVSDYLRSIWPHQIVCVSNAVRNVLVKSYFFSKNKIITIHNGIDSDRFKLNHESKITVRGKLAIPEHALVFGAIGRLDKIKGFETALELFKKLFFKRRDKELWFIIAGAGPERDKLEKMALHSDFEGKVKFMEFTDKPWELYPAFDFFLMPSLNEGLPLALLEAMSCGCCPIAMGVGGIPEIITSSELGWLVKPGDKENFFQAMNEAVELDKDNRIKMGLKARGRIVANFKASKQFTELADFIEKSCA